MSEHTNAASSEKVEQSQCRPSENVNPIVDQDQYLSREEVTGDETETRAASSTILDTDGLRVLAVDDSLVCLRVLVAMLRQCKYNVTETTNPVEALQILKKKKHEFDIVITDLRMLEMDGLVLLQKISLDLDLPVVMLSADEKQENVMKAIRYGARDYIIKPPRIDQIKNVWQHVVRKRLFGIPSCNKDPNNSSVTIEDEKSLPKIDESKRKLSETEGSSGKGKADEEAASTLEGGSKKKRRVNWIPELHNKFMDAIGKLGPNSVPTEIWKEMNVPGLTRANVASHLQKYKNANRGQAQQNAPQAINGYSYSINSAAGQNDYQNSLNSTQAAYSVGMMTQAVNTSPCFTQRLPYQQYNSNPRILPLGSNQHLLNDKFHNLSPTMLNNAPLPPRTPHPPVPQFSGLKFSSLDYNMTNSSPFCQSFPSSSAVVNAGSQQNDILPNGQNFSNNMYPQLDWTAASDIKTGSFDVEFSQTRQMETWAMNNNNLVINPAALLEASDLCKNNANNMNIEVTHFHSSTSHNELPIEASRFQPINANLSGEDDNDELNSMVNSFNFEGPPTL